MHKKTDRQPWQHDHQNQENHSLQSGANNAQAGSGQKLRPKKRASRKKAPREARLVGVDPVPFHMALR